MNVNTRASCALCDGTYDITKMGGGTDRSVARGSTGTEKPRLELQAKIYKQAEGALQTKYRYQLL